MARRTKEDALATRHQLLDAAEQVFAEKGVSRTCLNDIAQAAGASRGAIYWHFRNKADLFNAMMDRITLPMEAAFEQMGRDPGQDPVSELRHAVLDALRRIATDERTRRVFEVATLKVEYVDELLAVKLRHQQGYTNCVQETQRSLDRLMAHRGERLPLPTKVASLGLHALVSGLIQTWLLDPQAFDLMAVAEPALDTYLRGLGLLPLSASPPPCGP